MYRLEASNDRFEEVRSESPFVKRGGDEVGEGPRCDLAFFFDGVHVHAKAELIVSEKLGE